MVLNSTNAFEIYKKVEKSGDRIKSPYQVISVILNQLHRNIHLMMLEIDKKKAFKISRQFVKCLTTIYSLQTSLDFENGGKIATNLFQLYEFCRLQIIDAFRHNKNEGLKKSYDALSQIVLAWDTMEK